MQSNYFIVDIKNKHSKRTIIVYTYLKLFSSTLFYLQFSNGVSMQVQFEQYLKLASELQQSPPSYKHSGVF